MLWVQTPYMGQHFVTFTHSLTEKSILSDFFGTFHMRLPEAQSNEYEQIVACGISETT